MFKRLFVILALYFCFNLTIQKRPKLTAADIKKIKKGLFLDSYMLSQNELFYDNDAQAKLRREIIGTWISAVISSYDDKHYIYNCDPFLIRFVNDDGTLLSSETLYKGSTPAYSGETPTKPADAEFTYTFAGWEPKLVPAVKNATYKATYTAVRKDVEMDVPTEKIIKDNTIYLQHGDHIYTLQGQLVK